MKRAVSHKEHLERLDFAVTMENVTVAFEGRPALLGIDLEIPAGVLMGIIGPNNAGKTTLLKTILGLVKPSAGNVYVFSRPAKTLKNDTAYVPARTSVNWSFPTTVHDLVLMGSYNRLKIRERPKISDREFAENALKQTELYDVRKKSICDTTRGERQRALIARALVQDARIYVMDEPLLASDEESEKVIINVLLGLKARGKTVIAAHHDIMTIPKYFDRAAFINVRKIASGRVEDIFNDDNLAAAYGSKEGFVKPVFITTGQSDAL